MRFMMMIRSDESAPMSFVPTHELMDAIGKLSDEMTAAGVLLDTGGLLPSAKGARLDLAGGAITLTDGPFTETKELIGGYAILRAKSKEEAIQLGTQFLQVHADILGPSCQMIMEIRQMMDASDVGAGNN